MNVVKYVITLKKNIQFSLKMNFNSMLLVMACFICVVVLNRSSVDALRKEMEIGFSPIATVELASQDFSLDYNPDTEFDNYEEEKENDNHLLRGARIERASEYTTTLATSIAYNGGPVMTNPIYVYPIWYGTWTSTQIQIVNDFLDSLRYYCSSYPIMPASVYSILCCVILLLVL